MSRAKQIRERSTKVVVSPHTGQDYEITRVLFEDIFADLGDMPMEMYGQAAKDIETSSIDFSSATEEERKTTLTYVIQNIGKVKGFYNACLKFGVVDPRVVDEVTDPDKEVTPAQLGVDRLWLAEQVLEFSEMVGKKS